MGCELLKNLLPIIIVAAITGLVLSGKISCASAAKADTVFDLAKDFSVVANPNKVWQYGYSETKNLADKLFLIYFAGERLWQFVVRPEKIPQHRSLVARQMLRAVCLKLPHQGAFSLTPFGLIA